LFSNAFLPSEELAQLARRIRLHHDESPKRHPLRWRNRKFAAPSVGTSRGADPGFTKQYGLHRLVYCERFERIIDAIQREKNMKHWPRAWKVRLILAANPNWDDLYETLTGW